MAGVAAVAVAAAALLLAVVLVVSGAVVVRTRHPTAARPPWRHLARARRLPDPDWSRWEEELSLPLIPTERNPTMRPIDIVERFVWTGVQAFVGSLPATVSLTGHDLAAVGYSGLTAAVAAVISLAKNLAVKAQVPAGPCAK